MAKVLIAAAIMIAFLALAEASRFRTTITTVVEEDENQGGQSQQRCRQQIRQQQQQLRHCQQYLSQRSPFELDIMNQQGQQQQHLRECCQGLQNVEDQCQCDAVREAVRQVQQQGGRGEGQGGPEMQQVTQKARNLPQQCNLGRRECQIY